MAGFENPDDKDSRSRDLFHMKNSFGEAGYAIRYYIDREPGLVFDELCDAASEKIFARRNLKKGDRAEKNTQIVINAFERFFNCDICVLSKNLREAVQASGVRPDKTLISNAAKKIGAKGVRAKVGSTMIFGWQD